MNIYDVIQLMMAGITLIGVGYLVMQLPRTSLGRRRKLIFVDTSVLIDGRIAAIAQAGFVTDTLAIPRSVIGEMQYMADHADSEKRTRARRGLDLVSELQGLDKLDIVIFQDGSHAREGVDERLLKLAKKHSGLLCTIDYNLQKVALVEGVQVLNVNELAQQLRMSYLPGETVSITLTQKGQDAHQAVGHLADGTMVVVEYAQREIGKTHEVEIIRSLQTAAGRMMFAKLNNSGQDSSPQRVTSQKTMTHSTRSSDTAKLTKTHSKKTPVVSKISRSSAVPAVSPSQPTDESPADKAQQVRRHHKRPRSQSPQTAQRTTKTSQRRDREADFIKLVEKSS